MENKTNNKLYQLQSYLSGLIKDGCYGMTKATPNKIKELKEMIKEIEIKGVN